MEFFRDFVDSLQPKQWLCLSVALPWNSACHCFTCSVLLLSSVLLLQESTVGVFEVAQFSPLFLALPHLGWPSLNPAQPVFLIQDSFFASRPEALTSLNVWCGTKVQNLLWANGDPRNVAYKKSLSAPSSLYLGLWQWRSRMPWFEEAAFLRIWGWQGWVCPDSLHVKQKTALVR